MGAGHAHGGAGRGSTATGRHRRRLVVALAISSSVVVVQLVGALVSGSLALLADTAHVLTDAAGLAVALLAASLAARPATPERTYGLLRAEVLAALGNALLLTAVAVGVTIEAVRRWDDPPDVAAGVVLGVALAGAAANAVALVVLHGGAAESLNVRGAYLEVLADLVGSAAVAVAAVVVLTTGYARADVIASLVVVALVLPRAWSLLREVVDVLLEATPRGVDVAEVRRHILEVPGVVDVHDLHLWTITSGMPVMSAHVVVDEACVVQGRTGEVLDHLGRCLAGHFDVEHCTFQVEPVGHQAHEAAHHA